MELHVKYLCSLEDGERTRVACVRHLQIWLPNSYPHCPAVVAKMQDLARSLVGAGSVVTKDVLANGTVAGNRDHFVPLGQQSIGRGARFDAAENRRARAN